MSTTTMIGRRRRLVTATAVALTALVLSACQGTWGIRGSYRSYVAGPIGHGEIVPVEGATWQDGPGAGKGPFTWPLVSATFDETIETGTIRMSGGVATRAHQNADGIWLLDTTFRNPTLVVDGDTGTLYADLNFRPFEGTNPATIPPLQAAVQAPLATVDLSGVDWTPNEHGARTITDAPMTGIQSTMELISWDDFYGTNIQLDPLSVTFKAESSAAPMPAASVTVSQTEGLAPGDVITVWGSGFDPAGHVGARPPLAGQPSGAYVIFGKFADTWQPSAGAPSSSRSVIDQKWSLPEAQHLALDPTQANPSFVRINADGTFVATLTVGESAAAGNYGIYTYPGSGAVNAGQEVAQLVTMR